MAIPVVRGKLLTNHSTEDPPITLDFVISSENSSKGLIGELAECIFQWIREGNRL